MQLHLLFMSYHLKPINFRKYSLILIYSLISMAIIAWCMEFYFQRIYGDIARIGYFPERYFGWQGEQPAIEPELFKDYSFKEADIVVIGDSFSVSRVWQSRLIKAGFKVCTMTWQELQTRDEALPKDLGVLLHNAGFKGRYVIIESIERLFQQRMENLVDTAPPLSKHEYVINANFPLFPFTQREVISFNKLNGADWGVKALVNTIKLHLDLPEKYLKSGAVQAVKFEQGCQLFSNRLCHYAIFVDGDFKKHTFNSIDRVLTINKNLQVSGFQAIWLIVPDKSTVYLGYGNRAMYPYENIWQLFAQHQDIVAPDLGTAFIKQSRIIKDFYMPNDTHISTNGHLFLGELMTQGLLKLQANQPNPFSQ